MWIWQDLVVRDNDGRKLDHRTLEVLRFRAVEQVQAGAHPEDVAVALGLHRKTVYGWPARYREGGREALRARPNQEGRRSSFIALGGAAASRNGQIRRCVGVCFWQPEK